MDFSAGGGGGSCCKGTIFFLRFENYCAKIMQYTLFYGSIIVNYLPLVFSVLLCLDSFLIGEIAFPKLFFCDFYIFPTLSWAFLTLFQLYIITANRPLWGGWCGRDKWACTKCQMVRVRMRMLHQGDISINHKYG